MKGVLVVGECLGGKVRSATLCAITAALQTSSIWGKRFTILLLGNDCAAAAAELREFGAERILVCEHVALKDYTAEAYAPTICAQASQFAAVLAAASSYGKDLMPRVAAQLQCAYIGDCSGLHAERGGLVLERSVYSGSILADCGLEGLTVAFTVRQSDFAPATRTADSAPSPVELVPFVTPGNASHGIQCLGVSTHQSTRPDLAMAKVVVAGGRPLKSQFFQVLGPLAQELGAAIGATRAACDGGYAPNECQVGQTGRSVGPELYIAIGISGALQHLAGMRSSRVVVAINQDPEAPIFRYADYGLVADLFDAVPKFTRALADLRERSESCLSRIDAKRAHFE